MKDAFPANGERIGDFILPVWFTRETIVEFFSMWACFHRTEKDYYSSSDTEMNFARCRGQILVGMESFVEGEYFHKSSNIGWIFDGEKIHHVFNAKKVF